MVTQEIEAFFDPSDEGFVGVRMSLLAKKRSSDEHRATSGLPSTSDILGEVENVSR